MSRSSIFEGVVRSEDSHTNLLRNLINTDEEYGRAVFRILAPPDLERYAAEPFVLRTQVSLKGGTNGRADILIESESVLLIVEVKTDLYCGLTANQDLVNLDKGYLAYLLSRKTSKNHVGITFLAPSSWRHATNIRSSLADLEKTLPTKFVCWEDLVAEVKKSPISTFAAEFNKLLEHSLKMISFNNDEKKLLESQGSAFSSASRKLYGLVWQTRKQIMTELANKDIVGFRTDWADDVHESGYLLYFEKEPVLWVGVWDISPFPLVAAVKNEWKLAGPAVTALGRLNLQLNSYKDWQLYSLTDTLLGADPLGSIMKLLIGTTESILRSKQ